MRTCENCRFFCDLGSYKIFYCKKDGRDYLCKDAKRMPDYCGKYKAK